MDQLSDLLARCGARDGHEICGPSSTSYLPLCLAIPLTALRTLPQLRRRGKNDGVAAAASYRSEIHRIQALWGGAFAARPISASLLSLLLISIPFGLVLLAAGGWRSLGPHDWVMAGIVELPPAFVVALGLISIRSIAAKLILEQFLGTRDQVV